MISCKQAAMSSVDCMYTVRPRDGLRILLRISLLHVECGTNFPKKRRVSDVHYRSSREACQTLGLLIEDAKGVRVVAHALGSSFVPLTHVLATILDLYEPTVHELL